MQIMPIKLINCFYKRSEKRFINNFKVYLRACYSVVRQLIYCCVNSNGSYYYNNSETQDATSHFGHDRFFQVLWWYFQYLHSREVI